MDDKKKLYDRLSSVGVNLGTYEEYEKNISDPDKAKKMYDRLTSAGFQMGDYGTYMQRLGHGAQQSEQLQQSASKQPTQHQQNDSVYAGMSGAQMMNGGVGRGSAGSIYTNGPTGDAMRSVGRVNPVTGQVSGGGSVATARDTDLQSQGYIDLDREEREAAEAEHRKLMRDYMEQTGQIDRIKQLRDEAQQRLDNNPDRVSWTDRALGLTNIYHGTLNAWKDFKNLFLNQDVAADKRIVKQAENALEAIDEAGYADDGFWSKQMGGVFRGAVNTTTDSDTWDFGLGGVSEGLALKRILDKQQQGEQITPSEEGMLTMMGLKAYVDDAYGEEAGMGYRVGASLPQSAGFMVQMYLNPLGGLGKKTGEYFGKAALKHLAGQGMSRAVKKGLFYGAGWAGRLGGDIVEQAGTTLLPGAGRVYEDALRRDNGQSDYTLDEKGNIQYLGQLGQTEEEKGVLGVSLNSLKKSLGSNFIENWSESVGEYFDPVKKGLGAVAKKGVDKLNSQKLNNLYNWMMDVRKNDFLTAMDKFKQKTKYDGVIGEYMEEVVGNVTNAATVGDNNFSVDPDSAEWQNSVFNPEMNAETFLSCALMAGTMRAVEGGVNYGQRRYINGRLNDWENKASELMGDQWADIKRYVDNSEPGDVAEWLNSLRKAAESESDKKVKAKLEEQVKAVHNYAFYRSMYQAYNTRRVKDEEEMTPEQKQEEAAVEMQGQAEDVKDSQDALNQVAASLDQQNSQLRANLDDMLRSGASDGEINELIDGLSGDEQKQARAYVNSWKNAQRAEDNNVAIQQQKQDEAYEQERVTRRNAYRNYKLLQMQLGSEIGEQNAEEISSATDASSLEQMISGLTPAQQESARKLNAARITVQPIFTDMQRGVKQVEEQARQQAERDFTTLSNTDSGELVQVTAAGIEGNTYVTSGRLTFGADEDGNTVVIPSESDDMLTLIDEHGNAQMTTPSLIKQVVSRKGKEQYVQESVQTATNDAMDRLEAELETPELTPPAQGGRFVLPDDGRQYVIAGVERGAVRAYRLSDDGAKIDEVNPNEVTLPASEYYELKARELWDGYASATSDELRATSGSTATNGSTAAEELPKLEDGTTDFDALFEQSVGRFYEEYAREFGTEEANNALAAKRDSYYKKAENIRKKAAKAGSFNKRSALNRKAAEQKKRGDEVGKLIGTWKNGQKSKSGGIGGTVDMNIPTDNGVDGSIPAGSGVDGATNNAVQNADNPREGGTFADAEAAARAQAERVSLRSPEEQAAAQAAMQERIDREQAQRDAGEEPIQRKNRRFGEEEDRLDAPLSVREMVAREIATGRATFKWDDRGDTKGLGAHTANGESERRRRIWALNNKEGERPEVVAERIHEMLPDAQREQVTSMDVLDIINELMTEYDSPTAMWDKEVRQPHAQMNNEQLMPGYADYDQQMRMEWEAEKNGMSVEDWQGYNDYVAEQVASLPSQEEIDNEITLNVNNYDDRRIETEVPAVDAGQVAQAASVDMGAGERGYPQGAALERERPGAKGGVLEGAAMVRQGDAETGGTGVRTAERGGQRNLEKRKELWSASTEHSAASGEPQDFPLTQQNPESGNVSALSQSTSSADKVSAFVGEKQENNQEKRSISAENARYNTETGQFEGVPGRVVTSGKANKLGEVIGFTENPSVDAVYDTKSGQTFFRVHVEDRNAETPDAITEVLESEGHRVDMNGEYPAFMDYNTLEEANQMARHIEEIQQQVDDVRAANRILRDATQPTETQRRIDAARSEVNTVPTDGQKDAGNYRKGHVRVDGYDISIENPKGSVRSGVDANGQSWSVTMNNDYGYIRGTKAVDGDHIDVFLSDNPDEGSVFVVDQLDGNGKFDESKVMYGFNSLEEAKSAYLANYNDGWESRIGAVTEVSKEEFKKWIDSSVRKTKPFSEYKNVETGSSTNLIDVVRTLYTMGKEIASKIYQRSYFDVADTPAFMKNLGLRGNKFTIKYGVISRHIGKDSSHNLTESDWEQIPNALQNPFAISKLTDKDDSFRIYTTLKTSNGGYAVVGADVKNAGRNIEVNAISTVFGRRDNANLPMNEEVVYRSKEITPEQSSLLERPNSAQYTTAQELLDGDKVSASSEDMQVSSDKSSSVKRSKWVDEEDQERFAELKRLMLAKLGGQVNFGVDPEIFMLGVEMSYLVIKHGARQFVPYAKVMLEELGEAVRPYLRVIYSGTRYFDGMEPYRDEMTPSDELDKIDVSAIGKEPTMMEIIDTAAKEQEAKQQIGDVEQKVKAMKPKTPSRRKKDSPVQGDLFGDAAAGQNQSEQHQADQAAPSHQFYVEYVGDMLQLRRYTVMPNGVPIEDARPVARAKSERDMLDIINNPSNRFGKELDGVRKELTAAIEAMESSPKKTDVDKQGRQAERNGSELVVLSPNDKVESFPTPPPSSSSADKVTESSENIQGKTEENSEERVTLHQRTRVESAFSNEVANRMRSSLTSGEKPFRSIVDLRKLAAECGMRVDSEGRDDILIQELVEDALTLVGRELAEKARRSAVFKRGSSFFPKELFEQICHLYDMQPTISQRSSNRIKMQQYSTPLPMSFVADMFVAEKGKVVGDDTVLEPTAGNGMLVFAVPTAQLHVNELDDVRYENLRFGGYKEVTKQDATKPFEGGRRYAGVVANPPFGKVSPKLYDGMEIASLEAQIALNALESMKDDGRAAIIVGGNMEYSPNGAIKGADRALYSYLYDHYNVKGVVDMDGSLYRKQGTTYPTRMILIEGRRSDEERAQERIYPPVRDKAIPVATSFDELYDIVNGLLNSKEKTNGTAVLRREQGLGPDSESRPRKGNDRPGHQQPQTDDRERGGVERGGTQLSGGLQQGRPSVLGERGRDSGAGGTGRGADESRRGTERNAGGGVLAQDDKRVGNGTPGQRRVGLTPATSGSLATSDELQATSYKLRATSGEQATGDGAAVVERRRSLTDEKSAYRPHSKAFSLESVAPAAMTDAMDDALKRIENEMGDIDTFVQTELGYDSVEALHNALAAEQVDSVAMAIYQMKRGEAMIIGDQTGVGKGRQMAALIRWAVRQGKKPIFITQKADLFSDLYRDLVDIGSGDLRPFIFNSDGDIKDAKNVTVYKPLSNEKMRSVLNGDQLPEGYDFVVLTYSQLNKGDTQSKLEAYEQAKKSGKRVQKKKDDNINSPSPKPDFLRKLSKDNILLLDESHTAAGDGNTGSYLQSITRGVQAVTFASATFAKRPDTMPLYAIRTAMSKANVEADKLIQIIEKGGVTLQEIMSRALSAVGQMVRRERDMSDVKTEWKTVDDPATVERARSNYDKTVQAFNAIIKFQKEFVDPYIENLSESLASQMKSASKTRGTDKIGLNNVPFASKAYNYTKQLLLALKVDAIVDEVEREIQAGRHPVIALESTMESVLDGYYPGDVLGNATFGASLLKGLENTLTYSIKDEKNKEVKHKIPLESLPASAKEAYEEVKRLIIESTTDVFVSPIDDIISKLNARGYSVGELTGRDKYVSMEDGRAVVRKRSDKDKKRMTMDFNSGKTDVLILNKSASTGISLHASKRFSDQRQRTMVMAQPLSDINDYMQMIGRIDRTGQVHRGYYINLGLPVPAENRFMMMLSTKLKSLNANTTTSQDSKQSDVEAPDLLNKYGSQVIVEYLRDHPALHEKMGSPLNLKENQSLEDYVPQEDDARKVTGYVALLSVQEQEEFYSEVVERYNTLINYLNETDSNDLKISVMPLRAKTLSKKVASKGNASNGLNPFAQDSYLEQVEMDVLRKPYKADEVKKLFDQLNKGLRPGAYVERVMNQLHEESAAKVADENARFEQEMAGLEHEVELRTEKIRQQKKLSDEEKNKAIEEERSKLIDRKNKLHGRNLDTIEKNAKKIESALARFSIGRPYLIPDVLSTEVFTCSSPGILVGFKMRDDGITPSTSFAVFAVLDGRRRIEVKLSDTKALDAIRNHTIQNYDRAQMVSVDNWDSQIPQTTRAHGYILTGNIIQAFNDSQGKEGGFAGKLVSYTDMDGNIHDGILMPQTWNPKLMKNAGVPINARRAAIEKGDVVTSTDGLVQVGKPSRWDNSYMLIVPKSKKQGGAYYLNEDLLKLVGREGFYQRGAVMRAEIEGEERLKKVLDVLSQMGVRVSDDTDTETGDVKMLRVTGGSLVADEETDRELRDVLVERLRGSGIDVVMDAEEGQRVLDEANGDARMQAKKRALETAYSSRGEGSLTVISSADGAKVLQNLENLVKEYENRQSNNAKTFIGDVSNALGSRRYGSKSQYATFETKNGQVVTIRLSDHNASTAKFDYAGRDNGISIVISPKQNSKLNNDGNAHIVEYYYNSIKLQRAKGKPLADIVRSIQQALYSGEFTDISGLAERQEVNGNDIRYFRRGNGDVYGFVKGGRIYIDPERVNAETPIHEYAHLWASAMRRMNPKEWANIVELMKESSVWDEVKRFYPELESDEEIADEVLATYSGRLGAEKLRDMQREVMEERGNSLVEKVHAVASLERVKDALKRFWDGVAKFFNLHYTSAEEVADRVLYDLLNGVNPLDYGRESLESVNRRFNEELDDFKYNRHKGLLHLGSPREVLKACGIRAESITLSPSVLYKHLKKHNLTTDDLKGLAKAIQEPILVYKHGLTKPNIVVVTALDVRGGKLSVSFILDEDGNVVDVSNISSIHNKYAKTELERLYKMGEEDFAKSLRWVDKEKVLEWFAPSSYENSGTSTSQEPFDVAKIVENFENPSVDGENISDEEDLLFRVREDDAPENTGVGYKVFVLKGGQLYPPMVANPNGAATPVGVWLDADAAPVAGESKTGRKQVKAGGKGTQGGSGKLAYRPGWHLGEIPYALQFNRLNPETGERELFPKDFVWAEVEYAADVDYQEEAMSYGYNANGKFQHSLAGLPKLPVNGSYKYRTNPNPETDEWVITGAMKVNRILKPSEVDEMVREAGREPQQRQAGAVTDAEVEQLNESLFGDVMREGDGHVDSETISFENDPISKWMGVSRYSTRQQKAYAQRMRQMMREQVMRMGRTMGIEIEVVEHASELSGKRARAKGWFERKTGKVTVVLGNHSNLNDIMKTVLHEAVAHYGLRKLFGNRFDDFLDNVFANASVEVRAEIISLAEKHGYNFRTATEEYMARLAEEDDIREMDSWWGKVKTFFLRMLADAGVQLNIQLTDNELKYILWSSYENLAHPGRYKSVVDEVKDVAMQSKLKARSQSRENKELRRLLATGRVDLSRMVSEEDGDLYREVEEVAEEFAQGHRGAAECVAIRSLEDLERYISESGYRERPFTEDGYNMVEELYDSFENSNACYDKIQDKVLMFATDASENAQNTYLWHENVHRAVRELGLSDEDIDTVYQEINRMQPKKCEKIRSVYGENDYKEEVATIWIHSYYNVGGDQGLLDAINGLPDASRRVLLSIYNYVKYGTGKQQESAGREEGDSVRGDGSDVQVRNAKALRGVKKGRLRHSYRSSPQGFSAGLGAGQQPAIDQLSRVQAREEYDRITRSLSYHAQEAFQEYMLGLKTLQKVLAKSSGKPVQDYENAAMYENHLSSINGTQAEVFKKHFMDPILKAMNALINKGVSEQEIYDYLMKKHAIERNREMAVREHLKLDPKSYKQRMESWEADRDALRQQSGLTWKEMQDKLDKLANSYGATVNVDYSGLTEIYPTLTSYTDRKATAIADVEELENRFANETKELLERVKLANQAILTKQRESGLMSKETFAQISSMYEYYVPLRGFDDLTSDHVYDYINAPKSTFNAVVKEAKGRNSKADNPIAYIANMAESGIAQGNRNLMKQKFLLFVKNRPSDLVSVSDLWLYNDPQEGWVVKSPVIPENATPQHVQDIMRQFEEQMESEKAAHPNVYVKASERPDIPYRTLNDKLSQHQVIVKVNGKPVVITINGNPRAAQAVNGLMNPTADVNPLFRRLESVNRWLAANFTRNNPSFIAVNLVRDAIYSNSMIWVKESPKYALDYSKNWLKTEAQIYGLVTRYKKGTLDMNNKTDKMFYDFITNGGETGYNFIHGTDEIKGEIQKRLKRINGSGLTKSLSAIGECVDTVNRWAEDVSRFAAYRTSIKHGRSVLRAVHDAKEVSVNFNTKGAGMKSGGSIGFLAQYCRGAFIFFNAGVQGMSNFIKASKSHPGKFFALGTYMMSLGAFVPILCSLIAGDDDDDDYWNIPEYIRRSNICIMIGGGKYVTIPLPIELRALYGIGEMATSVFLGKESFSGLKLAQQVSQILPVDFLEGKGDHVVTNLAPTYFKPAIEVAVNKSWTGLPIYKDSPYLDMRPSWTRAYKGTSPQIVDMCRALSSATGGVDDITRGWLELNPGMIEHLFQGYFGGVGKTITQTINSVNALFNEDMREINNIPVAYRFLKEANEKTRTSAINGRFIEMENRYMEVRRKAKAYYNRAIDPKLDKDKREEYEQLFKELSESKDFQRMNQFFELKKRLRKMEDYLKEDKHNEEVEGQYYMLKHQMLDYFN